MPKFGAWMVLLVLLNLRDIRDIKAKTFKATIEQLRQNTKSTQIFYLISKEKFKEY